MVTTLRMEYGQRKQLRGRSGQSRGLPDKIQDVQLKVNLRFVVELLGRVRLFATPWTAAHQASLSFTISQNLLRLLSIQSVMASNHLNFCHPLLLLPSIFPSIKWSFPESQLFASGGPSIGASASVLPMNIWGLFPLRLTSLIFMLF